MNSGRARLDTEPKPYFWAVMVIEEAAMHLTILMGAQSGMA